MLCAVWVGRWFNKIAKFQDFSPQKLTWGRGDPFLLHFFHVLPTIHSQDAEESGRNWIFRTRSCLPPPVSPYPAATQTANPQKCGCRQGARYLCASPHEEVKAGKLLTGLSSGVPAWLWVLVDACPEPATTSSPLFLDRATVPLKEHFDSLWKELGSFHGLGERLIFETRLHWPRDLRT